jgi:hypothetical protein
MLIINYAIDHGSNGGGSRRRESDRDFAHDPCRLVRQVKKFSS